MGHEPLRITEPLIVPAALDPDAVKIIRRLKRFGHEAYLVGGCVRDLSLGHIPKDFDIATSARPRQVKRLFRNSRIIGRRFKLVHIQFGQKVIEVSTFRMNPGGGSPDAGENADGDVAQESQDMREPLDEGRGPGGFDARDRDSRGDEPIEGDRNDDRGHDGDDRDRDDNGADRDDGDSGGEDGNGSGDEREDLMIRRDNVFGSAEQDAVRRDFTINALFYDVDENVVLDYVGGGADLERRVIRTIGEPAIRFQEDPVRILRAIKFAARLEFEIEPATRAALEEYTVDLAKCATPRLTEELLKLLSCGAARRAIELLDATGVLRVFLPELADFLATDARIAGFDGTPREYLARSLDALDDLDRGRRVVSNAILLGVLLLGPIRAELSREDDGRLDPGVVVDQVLRPFQRHLSISRRDAFQIKQVVIAQPRLLKQRSGRRRRLKPAGLVQRDYFIDALDLFRVECRVLGRDESEVRFWENLYAEVVEGRRRHGGHHDDAHDADAPREGELEPGDDGSEEPEGSQQHERSDEGADFPADHDRAAESGESFDSGERTDDSSRELAGAGAPRDDRGPPQDGGSPDDGRGGGRRRRRRRGRRGRGGRDPAGAERAPDDRRDDSAPSREHDARGSQERERGSFDSDAPHDRAPPEHEQVEARRDDEPRAGDSHGEPRPDDGRPRRGRRRRGGRGRNRDDRRPQQGAPHGAPRGGPDGPRIEFDDMRAGPLRPAPPVDDAPESAPVVEEDDAEENVEIDWDAPFQTVGDPGPISVIRTGIDQTEKKSRRRRKRKDGAQRELAKEVEDQPGLQALKMTEGDPRGHQTMRPQKFRRRVDDDRSGSARMPPFDFETDFESIDSLFPW